MIRGSFSPGQRNKALLIMTFVVTAVFLAFAAFLGSFSASPEAGTTTDKQIDAAVEEALQNEAESTPLASEEEERARSLNGELTSSESTLSDLKLQEVRDTYLRFEQAIPGVSVHYSSSNQCSNQVACADAAEPDQIFVTQSWAMNATPTDMAYELANAHAELAINTIWGSEGAAVSELQAIIPTCSVLQNEAVLEAAGVAVDASENASVAAMKEIIVDEMVGTETANAIYPRSMRTDYQLAAAAQIAAAHEPDVVVPVSSPSCN